ncbi:hypothetical protein FSP39_001414 [Pinctada imbricata]|uniref:E3 ubiquitin-protein ligase ZSWIM2 n=1 Tax=Pinctada imbricata TaxID=66713 RepID=A0AA88YWR4_PINIB|nr:hypothetical protein FSP39_001414 [Pinctada imbricata]
MSRSVAWRRTCSDAVFWRQTQALNATIYILRETGPTGFLLKEDGESKPVKVFLGDPHNCTCPTFKKERDLCKHICWLILKKFRVPQTNPVSWQMGLVEREINDMLFGATVKQRKTPVRRWAGSGPPGNTGYNADGRPVIQQREIGEDDCCPICQDELLAKHLPVTYCKFGCGNSIHIKCMKIWADHQKTSGDTTIKCPFCREDFGPVEMLKQESRNANGPTPGGRMDRHIGMTCQSCRTSPIEGKCYRCSVCAEYYLCQSCFNTQLHTNHPFEYRHKRNQRWRVAQRTYGAVLPEAVANDLLNRELTEGDYELLTQLDNNSASQPSEIPEDVIHQFPLERVREGGALLAPGKQCRVCLRAFEIGQFVRKLPRCKHKFHKDCIDSWLLHSHPTCPIDGMVVWDPISAQHETDDRSSQRGSANSKKSSVSSTASSFRDDQLTVPGVGIVRQGPSTSEAGGSVERSANTRRRVSQPGRLQARTEETGSNNMDVLRASFTLNGTAVTSNDTSSGEQLTATTSLPGSRLLGRTQVRRSSLSQRLAELNLNSTSANQASESGQQLRRTKSLRIHSHSNRSNTQDDQSNTLEPVASLDLALGVRKDRSSVHNAIFNTLSMLSNSEDDKGVKTPDSSRSSSSMSSRLSVRNSLLSRTSEIHSPSRNLPTLLESENENNPNADSQDFDSFSFVTSDPTSSAHQRIFQRAPRLILPTDINDTHVILTSVRSTPDSRASSHISLDSIRSNRLGEGVIVADGISEPRSRSSSNSTADRPPRHPRRKDNQGQSSKGPNSSSRQPQGGSVNDDTGAQLMERIQLFSDLYLGNDPRNGIPVGSTGQKPSRPIRAQLSNPVAAAAARHNHRRTEVRRRRSNEIALEGNAYSGLTLRDLI